MTRFLILFLVIAAPFSVGATDYVPDGWRKAALVEIAKEPKVEEAMWSQAISLWASVRDDGSRRDGYADYLCMLMLDAGKSDDDFVVVHIWDHSAMQAGDLREIGKADCGK